MLTHYFCHLPKGLERCFVLNTQEFQIKNIIGWSSLGIRSSKFSCKPSDNIVSWVFQVQNLRFFRHLLYCTGEQSRYGKDTIPMVAIQGSAGVSLKVRLCSPLAAGYAFRVGVVLDYPQLLSSSTSQ